MKQTRSFFAGLKRGEFSHSRVLWHQDEMRLRSSLTLDTAPKRDVALIVVMSTEGELVHANFWVSHVDTRKQ